MSEPRPSALRTLSAEVVSAGLVSPGSDALGSREAPTFAIAELPRCRSTFSRREFCSMAAVGLATATLSACDPGDPRIQVSDGVTGAGGTTGGPVAEGPGVDAASGESADLAGVDQAGHDLAHPPGQDAGTSGDMAHNTSACSGPYNAGLASAIAVGAAKYLTDNTTFELFLCRDAGGLYALTASCPHKGVTLTKQATKFHCTAHGANFDLNGQSPTSPAFQPLEHYALCVDGSGNVLIDYNSVVSASTRA